MDTIQINGREYVIESSAAWIRGGKGPAIFKARMLMHYGTVDKPAGQVSAPINFPYEQDFYVVLVRPKE